jgi:hypothetical protein
MSTTPFEEFLECTAQDALAMAQASDVLELERLPMPGIGLFQARFQTPYLAWRPGGDVAVAPGPLDVLIRLGPDHLDQVDPLGVVQVRQPDFWHPDYAWPTLRVEEVRPAMPLPALLRLVYELLTYQSYSTDDGLYPVASRRLRDDPQLLERLPRSRWMNRWRPGQPTGVVLVHS